jgi:hypothetical protein
VKTKLVTLLLCSVVLVIQGCKEERVSVPPPGQDKAPNVTIHALASGGSGQIEEPEISYCPSPCKSFVTLGTYLLITADAINPGGVQKFRATITQGGSTLYTVETTGSYDANNKVPKSLSIIGSNGAGGIGSNPLLIHISNMSSEVTVTATAVNFNGMPKTITAIYAPLGHVKADISASSTSIDAGQQVILSYHTEFAHYPIEITNYGTASLSGDVSVYPTKTTKYTLIASNFIYKHCTLPQCEGAEQVKKSVTVTVKQPPQPPQPQTMRINLQAQPMGPQGGFQPFVYTFVGTVSLQQIELPTDAGNFWVAAIKLPKLGYTTDYCGDATKYVLLPTDSRTTPQQMKEIYGSETPTISPGGRIVACVSPKPGVAIGSSVGVLITYTH